MKVYLDNTNFFSLLAAIRIYRFGFTIVSINPPKSISTKLIFKIFLIKFFQLDPKQKYFLPTKEKAQIVSDLHSKVIKMDSLFSKKLLFLESFFSNSNEEILIRKLSDPITRKLFTALDLIHMSENKKINSIFFHNLDLVKCLKILYPDKKNFFYYYPNFFLNKDSIRFSRNYDLFYFLGFFDDIKSFLKSTFSNLYLLVGFVIRFPVFIRAKNRKKDNHLFSLILNRQSNFFNDLPFLEQYIENKKSFCTICPIGDNARAIKKSFSQEGILSLTNIELFKQISFLDRAIIIWKILSFQFLQFFYLIRGIDIRLLAELNRLYSYFLLYESYFLETNVKILWVNIEGNNTFVHSAVLAAKKHNIKTAGFSWSMPYTRNLEHSIFRNEIFFYWNQRQRKFMEQSNSLIDEYVEIGYPIHLQPHKEKFYKRQNSKMTWILLIDNFYNDDAPISIKEHQKFTKALFRFLEKPQNHEIGLILKVKKNDSNFSSFQDSIKKLADTNRLIINFDKGNFDPEEKAILVLSCGSQSLAFASYHIGMSVIAYDPEGYFDELNKEGLLQFNQIKEIDNLEQTILSSLDDIKKSNDSTPLFTPSIPAGQIIYQHLVKII